MSAALSRNEAAGADGPLEAFRRSLASDPSLAARLAAIEAPAPFAEAAIAAASARASALPADELERALRPDPAGIGRFMAAPVTSDRWPPAGWAPAQSVPTGGPPAFDWIWLGSDALSQPFYGDSVRRMSGRPFNLLMRTRTSLEHLVADSHAHAIHRPDGLIFHMSRCGSTLLAQMLAQIPGHAVLSEPEPLDAVIQWASRERDGALAVEALKAIVTALARGRTPGGGRLFVKLDAWHALALPLLRKAFPDVPWVFLYRDPIEVLASQMRMPGVHAVPGVLPADPFGIETGELMSREEYCARVLERICKAVIDHWDLGGGMLLNYSELSGPPLPAFAHFGFEPGPAEAAAMSAVRSRHAKTGEPFADDRASKHSGASPAVRNAANVRLRPLFDRLETLRRR